MYDYIHRNSLLDNNVNLSDYQFLEYTIKLRKPAQFVEPSPLFHSTRTITMSIFPEDELHLLDLESLYTNTILSENAICGISMRDHETKTLFPSDTTFLKKKAGFRHQLTVRIKSLAWTVEFPRFINVMVFQNGRLTITGTRTTNEVLYIIDIILGHVIENASSPQIQENTSIPESPNASTDSLASEFENIHIGPDPKSNSTLYQLSDFEQNPSLIKCQTMNYHFNTNFMIDNNQLCRLLQQFNFELESPILDYIEYDPERFSGAKIRFKEQADRGFKGSMVVIFQTGAVNIYRSSSLEEVEYVYDTITEWMRKFYNEI